MKQHLLHYYALLVPVLACNKQIVNFTIYLQRNYIYINEVF